jgi:hypothetical protein
MSTIPGSGEYRYRVVENGAELPDGLSLADAASVAVACKERIYLFIAGGLAQCRIGSKHLALQIKAIEEGLLHR